LQKGGRNQMSTKISAVVTDIFRSLSKCSLAKTQSQKLIPVLPHSNIEQITKLTSY
jgi:hypothetical protein